MSSEPSIALVGGGAAAVCVLHALSRTDIPGGTVTVFEPSAQLWRGRAYQSDLDCVRVNATACDMSVQFDEPDGFAAWLSGNTSADPDEHGFAHPPRAVYGHYLEATAHNSLAALRARGWRVRLRREAVVAVAEEGRELLLQAARSGSHRFDRVVLCVGTDQAKDAYSLVGCPGFTADPYPLRATLPGIANDRHVAVLGTGLTAVDVVLGLRERGHSGPITMVSRSGILPAVRRVPLPGPAPSPSPSLPSEWDDIPTPPDGLSWSDAAEWLAAVLRDAGADADELRHEVTATLREPVWERLRRHLRRVHDPDPGLRLLQSAVPFLGPRLWSLLTEPDRGTLLAGYRRVITSLCCPMTPGNAVKLLDLADSGRLTVRTGVRAVTRAPEHGFVIDTEDGAALHVDHVVCAAGSAAERVPVAAQPLVGSLLAADLGSVHPHGGLRVDPRTSRLLTPRGPDPRLYALGDLTMGTFLFTFGIPALVERAREIAVDLSRTRVPAHHNGSRSPQHERV